MGLDMVEATSGMGMHLKDIPPAILERQMKVGISSVLDGLHSNNDFPRRSGSQSPSTMPPFSAQKHPSSCNTSASSLHNACDSFVG